MAYYPSGAVGFPAAFPPQPLETYPPYFPTTFPPQPLEEFDAVSNVSSSVREEEDFTYFKYSKAKLPFLLLLLGIFTTLILLTMWQSRSDISGLRAGIPRDLEVLNSGTDKEGGIPKYKRNIRFATTTVAISLSLLAFLVFWAPLKPAARNGANFVIAIFLLLNGVLSIIVFALDMNSERDANRCTGQQFGKKGEESVRCLLYNVGCNVNHYSTQCEMREDIASGITLFDAGVALFNFLAAFCLIVYSRTGDWSRARDPKLIAFGEGPGQLQPGMYPNGVSFVRKWITILVLFGLLGFAVLLLVFTIIVQEDRERYTIKDNFGRAVLGDNTTSLPGWPARATKLRYATSALVILTILVNIIPITSRVVAYIFGFLYIMYSILAFVTFAVDIDALEAAKKLLCPDNVKCVYHPYNTCAVLDFLGGFILFAYVAVEYFVSKRKPKAPQAPQALTN